MGWNKDDHNNNNNNNNNSNNNNNNNNNNSNSNSNSNSNNIIQLAVTRPGEKQQWIFPNGELEMIYYVISRFHHLKDHLTIRKRSKRIAMYLFHPGNRCESNNPKQKSP